MTSNFALKTPSRRRKTAGFNLTELAIVLAVMGIILSALWGLVAVVRENMKREETAEQHTVIVDNIRSFFLGRAVIATPAGLGGASDLTHYLLAQSVLLPEMIRDRAAAVLRADHLWGAAAADGSALASGGLAVDDNGNGAQQFRIEYRGLKRSSCIALASKLSGPASPTGLEGVFINGVAVNSPVSPEDAAVQCVDPAGISNRIDYVYRLRAPLTN